MKERNKLEDRHLHVNRSTFHRACFLISDDDETRFIVLHVSEIKCYNAECVCLTLRYCLSGLINISLWLP